MKRFLAPLLFFIAVSMLATLSCHFLFCWHERESRAQAPGGSHPEIHRLLGLNEEQQRALEPMTRRYLAVKNQQLQQIASANQELAQALLADREYSPRVRKAVQQGCGAQAALQDALLEHIFEMKSVLTGEQFDRLLELTAQTLSSSKDSR